MGDDEEIDAVVVAVVPLTPQLRTTPEEIAQGGSLTERIPALLRGSRKPVVAVIDSGALYEPMAQALREGGVPTFRTADQAVRSLGRYLCHRTEHDRRSQREKVARPAPAAVMQP